MIDKIDMEFDGLIVNYAEAVSAYNKTFVYREHKIMKDAQLALHQYLHDAVTAEREAIKKIAQEIYDTEDGCGCCNDGRVMAVIHAIEMRGEDGKQ